MCNFHSQENTNTKTVFVECEWNGQGDYSLERVVCRRNGLKPEDLTNKQVRAINRHYKALRSVVTDGDIKAIKPGGVLHGLDYWDVYLIAVCSSKVSDADQDWIRKELLTAVGGDGSTMKGGDGSSRAYGTSSATSMSLSKRRLTDIPLKEYQTINQHINI